MEILRREMARTPGLVLVVLALGLAALAAPGSAGGQTQDPAAIAAALRNDPVFADPAAKPTLTPVQAGRVRLAILEKDLGRIKIAIVTPQTAGAQGGVRPLADAIDQKLRIAGTLLVMAGDNAWITTSYNRPQAAVVAVRRAFAGDAPLVDQLVKAVDGIAAIDPGPSGDLERSAPGTPGNNIDDAAEGFINTIKLIFWIVGGIIALPFLFGALALLRAIWRSVRRSREAVVDTRSDTQERIVQLGERIRELDAQAGVFESDPAGQQAYAAALDSYERAERLLAEADSPERLARVNAALDEGQRHITEAKSRANAASGTSPPAPTSVDAQREQANKAFGRE
jgi:hypothetical protein